MTKLGLSKMWWFPIFFAMGLLGFQAQGEPAVEPVAITLSADRPIQSMSLDGTWEFHPATGDWATSSVGPADVDAGARQIQATLTHNAGWYPLGVPQFLNRTVWWLTRVSEQYEQQETARIAAMPFDAPKTAAGWYLRQLALPPVTAGPPPEVRVNFEGIAMVSRIYCNGHYVGGHLGMFGQSDCRLTPFLKWGATNTLLVYAERGQTIKGGTAVVGVAETVPVTRDMLTSLNCGMFGGFGRGPRAKFLGIWQPVTLKISQAGGRIADVFFNPSLTGHKIEFTLANPTDQPVTGALSYTLCNVKTKAVLCSAVVKNSLTLAAHTNLVLTTDKTGLSPELWTPEHPNLYELTVEWRAVDGGAVVDRWTHEVGYRTAEVRGKQFYLNDHPYWCRAADTPPYGYKPTDPEVARGFLQLMHDGNTMVTRAHCNPWNDLWYSAADEIGVGVCSEGVRPWALMSKTPPPPPAILAQWKQETMETVRRYRNHPSILFYCISNEGLQGDSSNPLKLAIFKDIIEAVRKLHPGIPIFQTSGDPDVDHNADLESIHSYWGWYEPSSYVNDYSKPQRGLSATPGHALFNLECAVPYQMTDTGSVHPQYVGLYSAQPWVGELGVYGDPKYFTEHVRAEAKRKTEKLRYQRQQQPTAGMAIFCDSTWITGALSRPRDQWKPLPVYDAVRQGYAPVLAAWETPQSVFFGGDTVKTRVYVVNDDGQCRNLKALKLRTEVLDATGRSLVAKDQSLGDVKYYDVRHWPLEIKMPTPVGADAAMVPATVRLTLTDANGQVDQNTYPIRIATHAWADVPAAKSRVIVAEGCDSTITAQLAATGAKVISLREAKQGNLKADVVVIGPDATKIDPAVCLSVLKSGGRLLALDQGSAAARFCPEVLRKNSTEQKLAPGVKKNELKDFMFEDATANGAATESVTGEFVEMLGWSQHPAVFAGLDAMDWKWWARGSSAPSFACTATHHLDLSNADVLPLGRYLAPHFYWSGDLKKVYQSKLSYPVFAVRQPWGDLVVCDLAINDAAALDSRATRTLANLIAAPLPWPK
jgi:hypothetical protein